MENMPEFNSDRREFFRINDTVLIEFSALESDEVEQQIAHIIKNPPHNDDDFEEKQLKTIQTSLTYLTDQINQYDREVARALRLLDEKLNIISLAIQRQQNTSDMSNAVDANLSGGGIAFLTDSPLTTKSAIEIHIEFQPLGSVIHAIAHVVACNKNYEAPKETPYLLRLVFTLMSEADRNLLVKHTLSRQAQILRLNKD